MPHRLLMLLYISTIPRLYSLLFLHFTGHWQVDHANLKIKPQNDEILRRFEHLQFELFSQVWEFSVKVETLLTLSYTNGRERNLCREASQTEAGFPSLCFTDLCGRPWRGQHAPAGAARRSGQSPGTPPASASRITPSSPRGSPWSTLVCPPLQAQMFNFVAECPANYVRCFDNLF